MSSRIPSLLIVGALALSLLSLDAMYAQGKGPKKLEKYTSGDNTFALYKPPGWKVDLRAVENGKAVTVSDPKGGSHAVMRILKMQERRENCATLKIPMRGRYYFTTQYPDATVFGYEAPDKEFEKQKPLLLAVHDPRRRHRRVHRLDDLLRGAFQRPLFRQLPDSALESGPRKRSLPNTCLRCCGWRKVSASTNGSPRITCAGGWRT